MLEKSVSFYIFCVQYNQENTSPQSTSLQCLPLTYTLNCWVIGDPTLTSTWHVYTPALFLCTLFISNSAPYKNKPHIRGILMYIVAFTWLSDISQSASCSLDWVLNSQSDFDWVAYKHHWEIPIRKKTIQIWTRHIRVNDSKHYFKNCKLEFKH